MGAGASAKTSESLAAASAEDLQAALANMPEEDRAKLQAAWTAVQAPAEAGTSAEASAEAASPEAAPAEPVAEDTAAAKAEPAGEDAAAPTAAEVKDEDAPYLKEYFDKAKARAEALIGDQEKMLACALDPELCKKQEEESKAWFESEAIPLLKKSFKRHDTNNTDVLEAKEAAVFFSNLVQEETDLAQAISALSIEAGVKMSMSLLESLSQEEREAIKPQIEAQMQTAIETVKADVQKKEDAYKADKVAHDAAAFKVLDKNKDGTIQLTEFLAAFEPGTEQNNELHIALGYITREEVEAQKKAAEEAKADAKKAAECTQQ